MNIAAVLRLSAARDPEQVARQIAQRLGSVPRFRQRLVRPPLGGGRPYWQDVPGFEPVPVRWQGGDPLAAAATLVCARLPAEAPLWRLAWLPLPDAEMAVVLVLHHVLADGMGGLAVLAGLVDGVSLPVLPAPMPPPRLTALIRDSVCGKRDALLRLPRTVRDATAGLHELRSSPGPGRLAPTSLTVPTSGRRQLRVVSCDLGTLRRSDATVNDVVLAAVTCALLGYLGERGETPPALVVSVPISRRVEGSALGNEVGVVPVAVPAGLNAEQRLRFIAERTAIAKQGSRGSSALLLSWMFRGLAAMRLGQYFIDHQRLVHTFESNLRGPSERLSWLAAGSSRSCRSR